MKIETKLVNQEKGIVQITTTDERWYEQYINGIRKFYPSNTWVCSFYPKGKDFEEWLARNDKDESERLKREGGNKGSKVHQAIEDLLHGETIAHDAKFVNFQGKEEELTPEEYEAIISFVDWFRKLKSEYGEDKVQILGIEETVINEEIGVAGTLDLRLKVDNEIWVIDFKISARIYRGYELQATFLRRTAKADRAFILQVGYKLNKNKYKLTEVEDCWDLYLSAKKIWEKETAGVQPLQRDYPLALSLELGGIHNDDV